MANPWFRLWTDMVNDPKWRTIARVSRQEISRVISVYLHMMTCASNAAERGQLQGWCDEDIATALDIETEEVEAIRVAMQGRVLDGEYLTGWQKRQPLREREGDSSTERVKAFRERQRQEDDCNATKRQETPREEEIRKEEKKPKPSRDASAFARFWDEYPKKKSKGTAEKAWAKINPNEHLAEQILQAVQRAKTSDEWIREAGQFIPHPASWLNAKGWEDELTPSIQHKPIVPMIAPDDGKRADRAVALAEINRAKGALKARTG